MTLMARIQLLIAILLLGPTGFPAAQIPQGFEPILNDSLQKAPFEPGEQLVYEVNWKPLFLLPAFKAGEIRLAVDQGSSNDRLKIEGWAISEGALSRVAGIDVRNYFKSEIDRKNFRSYGNFQQLREGSRHRDLNLEFDYGLKVTRILETDPAQDPPRTIRKTTNPGIPGPATDVLSALYVGRLRELQPGSKYFIHFNERGSFRNVLVLAEGYEEIDTPIGRFSAIKLTTTGQLFRGGGDLRIWYSRDALRVPVKFEADVKFGKVYGTIIRLDSRKYSKTTIRTN